MQDSDSRIAQLFFGNMMKINVNYLSIVYQSFIQVPEDTNIYYVLLSISLYNYLQP